MAFIDDHRGQYGVEPICRVLPIAPSTYYLCKTREADPEKRPVRARRDEHLRREVHRVWQENREVYGVRKIWRQLNREGIRVARCTVARLMRELGIGSVAWFGAAGAGRRFHPRSVRTPRISCNVTSRRNGPTSCGYRISRTWRPGAASSTWPS